MKHKNVVAAAKLWLIRSKGCNPVFTEKGSAGCSEIPDAIGWLTDRCIVVECKVSKADLLANCRKELKLGHERFLAVPWDLYKEVESIIPEGYGHCVIDPVGRMEQVRFRRSADWPSDQRSEIRYLRSRIMEVQRFGQ